MNNAKALTGIIAAAAVGAAVGIAYAPDKGSKTRKKIRRKAEDLSESVKDVALNTKDKTVAKASTLIDQGKKTVDSLVDKVSGKVVKAA
ncbi:YtxH domain-containing protein [Jiulongibacter sediminis]|mgnify:CR=1 FL=1|jgi:gas vesicle protein|uniref:YtxH domain-containing protein n=1 Tax=Jiulongibacter sediminis TaxID=1605367 RepID=UPI0026EC0D88|nr:YtxH domain-containing protein [Jiulongibacter sediminis]